MSPAKSEDIPEIEGNRKAESTHKSFKAKSKTSLLLLLMGVCVGWIIGLSVSPVLHIVIGSLIGVVMAIVGLLSGLSAVEDEKSGEPTPDASAITHLLYFVVHRHRTGTLTLVPLLALIFGILIGAHVGIVERTHGLLGDDPNTVIAKWKKLKIPEQTIAQRLFDQQFPPPQSPKKEENSSTSTTTGPISRTEGLFSGFSDSDVTKLRNVKAASDMRNILNESFDKRLVNFSGACGNDECLEAAVNELILKQAPDPEPMSSKGQ